MDPTACRFHHTISNERSVSFFGTLSDEVCPPSISMMHLSDEAAMYLTEALDVKPAAPDKPCALGHTTVKLCCHRDSNPRVSRLEDGHGNHYTKAAYTTQQIHDKL